MTCLLANKASCFEDSVLLGENFYMTWQMDPIVFLSGSDRLWDPVSIKLFWEPCSENSKQDKCSPRSCSVIRDAPSSVRPRVDWLETPESHIFKADLPGLKKEDVKVDVEDGNVLRIRGERGSDDVKKTDIWRHVERSKGHFSRKFRLPQNVQLDHVEAAVDNGVLTVTVPKALERKPEVRNIDISWNK